MRYFIDAGLSLLPPAMDTVEARAMLYAIGLQESRFEHRKQINGTARGFWQFERNGIQGVMDHPASAAHIADVIETLKIKPLMEVFVAVAYNDALACALARLLLWTLPGSLPKQNETDKGWNQYIAAWRPGRPRPETWPDNFRRGWELALADKV